MAKRRKISAPSADDLSKIEEEFRGETRPNLARAPIAQVAGEAASEAPVLPTQDRAQVAKNQADAKTLREAQEQGLLILEIDLDDIEDEVLVRDRTVVYEPEMEELRRSILKNGLRLPIEVFRQDAERPYGLLSGFRRLRAYRELLAMSESEKYNKIKVIIRDPEAMGGAFNAMVEENEIRASLSHFERGRIAVIAAQQGAYASTEDAVNELFRGASKAKRSKVRSFAVIFEELGDMLSFPEALKERDGLRVATALRHGAEDRFREVLEATKRASAEAEWQILEQVVLEFEAKSIPSKSGGRPKRNLPEPGWQNDKTVHLSSGVTLQRQTDSRGHLIRISGQGVDADLIKSAMEHLRYLFEKPD